MSWFRCSVWLAVFPMVLSAQNFNGSTELTPAEKQELSERTLNFYRKGTDPAQMDARPPKYNLNKGKFVHPHENLMSKPFSSTDPLVTYAGIKSDTAFQRYECEHFYKKHFPGMECDAARKVAHRSNDRSSLVATVEENDKVSDLVGTWVDDSDIVEDLDSVPLKGQITNNVWSGDYWQMRWGLTSYRPYDEIEFKTYKEAAAAYAQPKEWRALLRTLSPEVLADQVVQWSPAEKYDLTVHDTQFTLTNVQKGAGEYEQKDEKGDVPDWVGLCDGWAAASISVPTPTKPVDAVGPDGVTVTWYPDDIRAMATLNWANGDYKANFISGRCEEKTPKKYPNGRVSAQDCFDTNPATFHLALATMVGKKSLPFIMDVAFDVEIWNSPVLSYEFQYFNPEDPTKTGTDWTQFAVPYDETFRGKDRFQKPLTRGVRDRNNEYDDRDIDRVVGVNATVVYLDEADPNWGKKAEPNNTERVTYVYDLELIKQGNKWIPTGGEWHSNAHPDFLWVPQKNSIASHKDDDTSLSIKLSAGPNRALTKAARYVSGKAYPMCSVVQALVEASNETGAQYDCR